jgi:Sulfocyanin (SoxE) domain
MKTFITLLFCALFFSANAFAHEAFQLVSSEKKIVKESEIDALKKSQTVGKIEVNNLAYTEKEIRLVVVTGPEDDMLSYRIQGVRNPNLIVPAGATLKILFINADVDMRHDVRLGHIMKAFELAPEITETAGTNRLEHKSEDGAAMQAEEIVVKAASTGAFKYFCSVRGHAKGGMWGNILVGVSSIENLQTPEKQTHVHSPDEDREESKPHKHDEKTQQTPKKSDGMTDANHADHNKKDGQSGNMTGMNHGQHGSLSEMRSTVNIGDPMPRESSGTAWNPDSSPVYAYMKMYEKGEMLMMMGSGFMRYTQVGSNRDVSVAGKGSRSRFDAPTMVMGMFSKPIGEKSQIGFRAMVSLDPIIQRGYGYPLLYQTGELYKGQPIHDRQHPHDLFSELSVSFSHKVTKNQSFYLYAGFPGEPALGPPTFMHRISAMNNPDAPISHHWQDATHITWGVITAGYSFGKFKAESSILKGEEPDENRFNFDRPKLDSYSARLSFNPTKNWAFQVSHGYLRNPEPSEPEVRIKRKTTASAIYNKSFGENKNLASTFIWGQSYGHGEHTNAFLFESNYDFYKNAIFGRFERVQKSGHELVLDHPDDHGIYNVGAYSLGYVRDLYKDKGLDVGLGGMLTINQNPAELVPYYGGKNHAGFQIFLRFRPSKLK